MSYVLPERKQYSAAVYENTDNFAEVRLQKRETRRESRIEPQRSAFMSD